MATLADACPGERLCALVSRALGEDPIASAGVCRRYVFLELPTPWAYNVVDSGHFPVGVDEVVKRAQSRGDQVGLFCIVPDSDYSLEDERRVLLYERPDGPFATFSSLEFVVPQGEVRPLVEALLEAPKRLASYEPYRRPTDHVRNIFVCTHGRHDVCCAKFGYPLYKALREELARRVDEGIRVWRASHFGGHRFAPTLMDFPEGRYWGNLDPEKAERLLRRDGDVGDLRECYRGSGGLGFFPQIVERELFMREGWPWAACAKDFRVVEIETEEGRLRPEGHVWPRSTGSLVLKAWVRVEVVRPGASEPSIYEATLEYTHEIETLGSSNPDGWMTAPQYRVSRLVEAGHGEAAAQ